MLSETLSASSPPTVVVVTQQRKETRALLWVSHIQLECRYSSARKPKNCLPYKTVWVMRKATQKQTRGPQWG